MTSHTTRRVSGTVSLDNFLNVLLYHTDTADKTAQNDALQTQLSHMQINEASLTRSPTDRDALRVIDEVLAALKADMAKESAEFLARLNDLLDLLDLLDQCHQDAADGLRTLSRAQHRFRYNLRCTAGRTKCVNTLPQRGTWQERGGYLEQNGPLVS